MVKSDIIEQPKVCIYCGTKGRYEYLALLLNSITNLTYSNWELIVIDDNDQPANLTQIPFIAPFLSYMSHTGHNWSVIFGPKKGPHAVHKQAVLTARTPLLLRVDDDLVLDREYLSQLVDTICKDEQVGAVGGIVLNPSIPLKEQTMKVEPKEFSFATQLNYSGKILENNGQPFHSPFMQWSIHTNNTIKDVEHLHCSYLYRRTAALISNAWDELAYDFLTPKGHNEETMASYGMHKAGLKLQINPKALAWHLYSPTGGIRTDQKADQVAMKAHDDKVFLTWYEGKKNEKRN